MRVSPQGDLVALADLPNGVTDAEGSVIVLDRTGRERVRLGTWRSLGGLAWSPDGREVWLSASGDGRPRTLHAVDLSGRERPLFSGPGGLDIEDVRADGRVLVRRSHLRAEVRGRLRGDKAERDLSLASHTVAPSLLPDGGALGLLTADESRGRPGAYLWRAGEAVPVRFADSGLYSLSPDGRTALCSDAEAGRPRDFTLVPTGPGEPRTLPRGSIDRYQWGFFGPDSRHVIFNAQEKGRPRRLFIQDTGGGDPRPLTPEGVAFELPRMTTTHVLNRNMDDPGDPWRLYPLDGGEPRPMPWLRAGDWPLAWDREGATLFLAESLAFPLRVLRLDVASGARRPWLETRPPDETAVIGPAGMELASDGCCYVYTYLREPAELFLVDGLH